MHIIVTGAAGFIGSNLSDELLRLGHKVTGIDNFSYGSVSNIQHLRKNKDFSLLEKDVRDPATFSGQHGDMIVHLASQKIPRYSNSLRTLDDNSAMLQNVVAKAVGDKLKIFYASTSDVYGKNPHVPYTEQSNFLLGPSTVKRWAYALSKIYGEHYLIANAAENELEFSVGRFFGSYGTNQNTTWWGGPQSVFIQNILENKPLELHGDGLQTRTFTYIADTVQGIIKCLFDSAAKNEIFNIANEADEEITIKDLALLIWKMMNGEDSIPNIKLIPYSTFGNYEDVMRRVPSIEKIKSTLGFKPMFPLAEGLKRTIQWQTNLFNS